MAVICGVIKRYLKLMYVDEDVYAWNINSKSHNVLLQHINNILHIDILLEKRGIKYIYNIINSYHSLHYIIALYSL